MNAGLDLRETPQLYLGTAIDEAKRSESMRARATQAIAEAESEPLAAQLISQHKAAVDGVKRLDNAARFLRQHAQELSGRSEALECDYMERLVEDAGEGRAPDPESLSAAVALEHQRGIALRAIDRISDRLRPAAELERLQAESMACLAISNSLIEIANARAGRLMERLAEAANDEICLPVDTRQGLIGAILAEATAFEERAGKLVQERSKLEREGGKK